ncbi:MAG: hypothetical protein RIQ78_487 [Bacteroidota bacterium]|jgi:hypothetical protein
MVNSGVVLLSKYSLTDCRVVIEFRFLNSIAWTKKQLKRKDKTPATTYRTKLIF